MPKTAERLLATLSHEERKALTHGRPVFRPPMTGKSAKRIFSDDDWLFERKLEGVRCLAVRENGISHLYDRDGELLDANFPDILEALDKLPPDAVVDGEIVAFDGKKMRLAYLEPYLDPGNSQPGYTLESANDDHADAEPAAARREKRPPPCWFYLFDLLQVGPYDLRKLPLETRKLLLRNLIRFSKPLRFTDHRRADGEHLFEIACRKDWEGIVAKRAASPYRSARVDDWLKIKCKQRQELVIGGYTVPPGSKGAFGELLIGYFEGQQFRYAGKVGTGFDHQSLGSLKQALDQHRQRQCPFTDPIDEQNCHWLSPELVCEVGFTAWTRGMKLRQPRYMGLRRGRDARAIVRGDSLEVA
ncbi:non-homologous end-joining DNA ligase [Hydrocarboniclastica marina]|nr:non-homologous end-joining DNA ligase [Hydrocarboniclastica marina]